jgi:AsmA-like C-terminal region
MVALGALITLAAILLLGVNLYVPSQGAQAKIQQELSRSLGVPLKIRSMSVTPWGGLELSGITILQTSSEVGPRYFLVAKTFRLRVRLLSLFSQRLVIKEVSLINPRVVWPQDAEGKWRLPSVRGEQSALKTDSGRALPSGPREPENHTQNISQSEPGNEVNRKNAASMVAARANNSASPPEVTVKTQAPTRESVVAVAPEVRRVSVRDGDFTFLDKASGLIASFTGVNFRTSIRSASAFYGDTRVARISLRDRFFLDQLSSPLRYEPDVLELSKISARVADGEVSGYFAIQLEAEDSPFTASVKFRDVLADQIVQNAGGPQGMVKGKLEGSFQASGKTGNPDALVGKGEIFLREGRVQQYRLLVLLGQILQIEELQELHLEQAEAKYHLTPGLVTIDELTLRSPNVRLTASGTVAFDGTLRLNSQLAINERVRRQLFRAIRDNFHPIDSPGYSAIEFQVGGTIDRPSTNLVERLVGRDISTMLNNLFGGKKERAKKKKKAVEEIMRAAPSSSVSPAEPLPEATATPSPVTSP